MIIRRISVWGVGAARVFGVVGEAVAIVASRLLLKFGVAGAETHIEKRERLEGPGGRRIVP